jgi:hypothetical protein
MALLCFSCSLSATLRSFTAREPHVPTYFSHLDEAAWFFLLGHGLHILADR